MPYHRTDQGDPAEAAAAGFVTLAREILRDAQSLHLDTPNEEVRVFFSQHPDIEVVVVVDDDQRPFGLINRFIFAEAYAHPFAREVYGKRSCIAWMDKEPLVMDEDTAIETLVRAAVTKGPKVLKDGFIGTRDGRYAGHGTGFALMKAMEALEAEKTRQVLQSIDYASTIQRSHLRHSDLHLSLALNDHFLHWAPRDVVGGDCYFFRRTADGLFGIIVDCTGHGVPGAFMSLIALSFLKFHVGEGEGGHDPGQVLTLLNRHIKDVLDQNGDGRSGDRHAGGRLSDDGLDAACFLLEPGGRALRYAGARLPLLVVDVSGGRVDAVDGDRTGIGYVGTPDDHLWQSRSLPLPAACRVLVATDGVTDQVGGPRNLSLGRRRTMAWLAGVCQQPAAAIGRDFLAHFLTWQGEQQRRDDVTFLVFTP